MQHDISSSPESDDVHSESPPRDHIIENRVNHNAITHDTPYSTPPSEAHSMSRSASPEEGSSTLVSPDLQRLQRDHSQQGYLDGITMGKPESVQQGFDSGYPFGAELGLQVGRVLGMLQGLRSLAAGIKQRESSVDDLERRARSELLDIQNLFNSQYWRVDETTGDIFPRWVSDVEYKTADSSVVVAKHPVVHRWTDTVESLMKEFRS
ncbi:hypothetical protein V1525DRAFT_397117 [Lipomyces kononenkoae]|uniref:Uncharacterized protein n=1 Tax=Lipomyces kononenkoae TaxID=34357 RepID=A0ACC3T7H5_LIPKO